ncbi:MAG: hypothetical protein K0Q49_1754 [Haloplasmataceae bacterium]|jgi:hypothetical protein|nr:hypothetical protein [Haloplasmataceae bacterium]
MKKVYILVTLLVFFLTIDFFNYKQNAHTNINSLYKVFANTTDNQESDNKTNNEGNNNDNLQDFFTNPFVVSIGWVIGLVSGIIQIKSYFSDRKVQGYLFEKAKMELKGNYTKEQIDELKKVLNDLEKQIKIDLPKLAKQKIREKQKEELATQIRNYYDEYKKIECNEINNEIVLDSKIVSAIQSEILNNTRRKTENLPIIIGGISLIVVIIFIFPYVEYYYHFNFDYFMFNFFKRFNLFQVLTYFISLMIITYLIKKFNLFVDRFKFSIKVLKRTKYIMYIIWIILLIEVYYEPYYLGPFWSIIGAIITFIPFTLSIILKNKLQNLIFR